MPSAYLNSALSVTHVFAPPLLSHARGKKKRHSWKMILEEPLEHPRCEVCSRRVGDRKCEGCNVDLCDSCATFTHPEVCFIVHVKVIFDLLWIHPAGRHKKRTNLTREMLGIQRTSRRRRGAPSHVLSDALIRCFREPTTLATRSSYGRRRFDTVVLSYVLGYSVKRRCVRVFGRISRSSCTSGVFPWRYSWRG